MYSKDKAKSIIDPENNLSNEDQEDNNEESENNNSENKSNNDSVKKENDDNKKVNNDDDNSEHDYSFFNLKELLEKGEAAYSQQKYKKATDIYKTLIEKYPDEVNSIINSINLFFFNSLINY